MHKRLATRFVAHSGFVGHTGRASLALGQRVRWCSSDADPPARPSSDASNLRQRLLSNNKAWAQRMLDKDPDFFKRLEKQQTPEILWIGCSDSRVPANQIIHLAPGEVFVHRNIANVVCHTDLNALSVIQFAVDVLKVRHIIVCGHYGCGGVLAAMQHKQFGLIDNWLRHIKDVMALNAAKLSAVPQGQARQDFLVELNVFHSAMNVCATPVVQNAWSRGQRLAVHAWCYRLKDGIIRDLGPCVEDLQGVQEFYRVAELKAVPEV